jgi:hypothetical protein
MPGSKTPYNARYSSYRVVRSHPGGMHQVVLDSKIGPNAPEAQIGRDVLTPLTRDQLVAMLRDIDLAEARG